MKIRLTTIRHIMTIRLTTIFEKKHFDSPMLCARFGLHNWNMERHFYNTMNKKTLDKWNVRGKRFDNWNMERHFAITVNKKHLTN